MVTMVCIFSLIQEVPTVLWTPHPPPTTLVVSDGTPPPPKKEKLEVQVSVTPTPQAPLPLNEVNAKRVGNKIYANSKDDWESVSSIEVDGDKFKFEK